MSTKQLVTAGTFADTDVIGFAQTETKACFAVLHFVSGNLIDKDFEILNIPDNPELAVSSLLKQYYIARGFAPRNILLPFSVEDSDLFSQYLLQEYGKKVSFKVPVRGDNARLVDLAVKNAQEEAVRLTDREERMNAVLLQLSKMLNIPLPSRIESYDISNISGTDIVAGMVVFQNGKPRRSEYKRFKIEGLADQDDYESMRQVISRRFDHYLRQDKGFDVLPDLVLIDGGAVHAATAAEVLSGMGLSLHLFGMVKDDRHRTRALVTTSGGEIGIEANQSVFSLIGTIQEETHRFAISYHRKLRSNRLRYSQLDAIPGIGEKRKQVLLKTFRSVSAIRDASLQELELHLPRDAAASVYEYFHKDREE